MVKYLTTLVFPTSLPPNTKILNVSATTSSSPDRAVDAADHLDVDLGRDILRQFLSSVGNQKLGGAKPVHAQ